MTYRIRITSGEGQAAEGGFASEAEATTGQAAMEAVYAAHPTLTCRTVVESYEPTRPLAEHVRAALQAVTARLGETDPLLLAMQGRPTTSPLLRAHDALVDAWKALSEQVYDEEGHF